ncbi:DUF2147 domain-containing protein [Halodurantibacterium flavum]|uniref:DUF2147 domain-containing protein n=1 Tax=Halodurantibacterium flavum TaxID=1382802 RepID=A0ABW4S7H0_9RHOB
MRKLILALALATAAAPALAADPVEGLWMTQPDNNGNYGHVQFMPCDSGICGVLLNAFDSTGVERPSEHVNTSIVWAMQPQGNGTYENGRIFVPDMGRALNSKMALRGDQLGVSGCILGFCREQTWTRLR